MSTRLCPACGSDDVMGVVLVDGDAPPGFGGHAGSTVTEETPAYGCCACGHQWGQWLAEYT